MKTFLFILVLVALIGGGLYLKNKGIFSGNTKVETTENVETPKENNENAITVPNSQIEPKEVEWTNVLKGEWNLKSREASENGTWMVEADIVFKEQKKFSLYVTLKYYFGKKGYNEYLPSASVIQGGNAEGIWELLDSSILKLTLTNCEIVTSNKQYSTSPEIGCDFFDSHFFGNVLGKTYQTKIEKFEENEIFITGKDYSKDGEISYVFTKSK